jgi:hypothetical protein
VLKHPESDVHNEAKPNVTGLPVTFKPFREERLANSAGIDPDRELLPRLMLLIGVLANSLGMAPVMRFSATKNR